MVWVAAGQSMITLDTSPQKEMMASLEELSEPSRHSPWLPKVELVPQAEIEASGCVLPRFLTVDGVAGMRMLRLCLTPERCNTASNWHQANPDYRIDGPFTSMPFSRIFSSSIFGEISNADSRLMYSRVTKS